MENRKKIITKDETRKIANLARLDLDEKEIEAYSNQLSAILEYVSELSEVDTKNTKATSQVTGLSNITREDDVIFSSDSNELIEMAPLKENRLIKVKGVFK